jgi:glutamate N-acetyltransferase / amino-acid N-acetyltransferase
MAAAISPLAPARFPDMPPVAGVKLATAAAGIRYGGRTDVLLALFEQGTSVAGVFTRSKCPSAPVDWCRAHLKGGAARARGQFRQRQCLYRQIRPRGDQAHRGHRR